MDAYLSFAIDLAQQAGDIMRHNFHGNMKKEWKEDDSPLTVTDTTINNLVIDQVKAQYPGHAILGEEASFSIEGADYVWVVDPVDGTIPFSHGVPTFVFSLALTYKGESIVGVVYDPIMNRLLHAEKDKGAFLNGQPLHVSTSGTLAHTVLNIDGPQSEEFPVDHMPKKIHEVKGRITKFSCLAYGGMMVALGEYSAAICTGWLPWDIAALKVIVEEAGGKVTSLYGEEQAYNKNIKGALISNGLVHDEVLHLLKNRNEL